MVANSSELRLPNTVKHTPILRIPMLNIPELAFGDAKINKNEELTLYSKDKQCLINRLWMEMFMKIQILDAPFTESSLNRSVR